MNAYGIAVYWDGTVCWLDQMEDYESVLWDLTLKALWLRLHLHHTHTCEYVYSTELNKNDV